MRYVLNYITGTVRSDEKDPGESEVAFQSFWEPEKQATWSEKRKAWVVPTSMGHKAVFLNPQQLQQYTSYQTLLALSQ